MRIKFTPDNLSAGNLGIENNNPGNLVYNPLIKWRGQTGENHGFAVFVSMDYGYRALIKNLQAYIARGDDTITKILNKWAPKENSDDPFTQKDDSNDPVSYIKHVSDRTGIPPNKKISIADFDSLTRIAAAISVSEIGTVYPDALTSGAAMAAAGASPGGGSQKKKIDLEMIFSLISVLGTILYIDEKLSKNEQS